MTLFDNGARYGLKASMKSSRGVKIRLDLVSMTAEVVAEFVNPRGVISASQGSMQILPSGNVLLGFGYNAAWTEFLPTGEAICDVHVGSQKTFNTGAVQTYHVNKYPWIGRPTTTSPQIVFREGEVHVSWNGATEIRSWVLETSMNEDMEGNKNSILDIGMVDRTGFETKMGVDCHRWPYVRAVAVDVKGKRLGVGEVVTTDCEWEIDRTVHFYFFGLKMAVPSLRKMVMGFVGCGVVIWGLWRWRLRRRGYIYYCYWK